MYSACFFFTQTKLVSALQVLHRLTHLRISITSDIRYLSHSIMIQWDNFMRTTCSTLFDFDGTATSCVLFLPALRCLFLETRGTLRTMDSDGVGQNLEKREYWLVSRGWHVAESGTDGAHDGGEPSLVELTDDVMERMIRNEELVLSDDEQVSMSDFQWCTQSKLNLNVVV